MTGGRPDLDPAIEVHESSGNVGELWDRFEIFEAIHHSQRICNPLTEAELDEIVRLALEQRARTITDFACGPGELLFRFIERSRKTVRATGDLSPWMLNRAAAYARAHLRHDARPTWILGDAASVGHEEPSDIVACLGADWIWRGMVGTVAALSARAGRGGLVIYGGPRLNFDADPTETTAQFGRLDTCAEVEAELTGNELDLVSRIDPGEAGWLAYLERGRRDVEDYARRFPGPRSDRFVEEQREWSELFDQDRHLVGWSVWVAKHRR